MNYPYAVQFEGPYCDIDWYRNATHDERMDASPEHEWEFAGGWAIYGKDGTAPLEGWWDTRERAVEAMYRKHGQPIHYPPPTRTPEDVAAEMQGLDMAYYRGWWGAEYIVFPPGHMDRSTRMPGVTIGEHGDYRIGQYWRPTQARLHRGHRRRTTRRRGANGNPFR